MVRHAIGIFVVMTAASAHAVFFDLEPNNSLPQAQVIARPSGVFSDVGLMELTAGDVDVLQIHLFQGETFTAVTTPTGNIQFTDPDTRMSLMDSFGTPLQSNDDAGPGLGSLIQYNVFVTGTYYLTIAGFDDPLYQGISLETGPYTLTVSAVPEPTSLMALGLGLAWTRSRSKSLRARRALNQSGTKTR